MKNNFTCMFDKYDKHGYRNPKYDRFIKKVSFVLTIFMVVIIVAMAYMSL